MAHTGQPYLWGGQGGQGPNVVDTDRSRQAQYNYVHDQQVRGHTGLRTDAEGAAEFFSQPAEVHGFSGTAGQKQPALRAEFYGSNSGFVSHRTQMQQPSALQMPGTQQPGQFLDADPHYFLRSIQQPPQRPQGMQFSRFEQDYSSAAGMHAPVRQHHLHPQFISAAVPSSGQMPDDSQMFQRFTYPVDTAFGDHREQPVERSLMPTPTWPPTPSWHHSDTFPSSSPPPSPLPDESQAADALSSGQVFPPHQIGANVGRPSQVPGRSLPPGQPSNLSHVSFMASHAPMSPSPPLQMHGHGGQGSLEGAMHGHQHLAEAARSILPASALSSEHPDARGLHASILASSAQDRSMSPEYPFSSTGAEDFTPMADARAPLPPSAAPANTFLQTIHESEGANVAKASERKLHNQASQASTTTSFGGGSRRFLARNVSSFSNSSVGESFCSRNSSMRSIGGASSYDFRFDSFSSFKDRTEPSEDNSEPCRPHKVPMSNSPGEVASSSPERRLSAATLAAAAEAAVAAHATAVADAAVAADPVINAAAAAAAIIKETGDIPLYLSDDTGDIPDHERQLVSDMGSLTRQLDQARSVLPAVIQVLSDTRPPFQLGLPALTKLLCNSSKRGRHAKALAIFHAAPALGLVPDLPLCNAALMAAGSAGNAAASSAIFGGMIAVGIQPDAVTYRASSTALAKQGHIQRTLQVLLHMLRSERVHDSTSLMTGVLAAGRHGAWAVGELMLLTAFRNRFQLLRLAALTPPPLSTVPEQFREVYLALCDHNGITPTFDANSLPYPLLGTSPAASQHEQSASQAAEGDNVSTGGGMADAATSGSGGIQSGDVTADSPAQPLPSSAATRTSPLGSTPVTSADVPMPEDGAQREQAGSAAGAEAAHTEPSATAESAQTPVDTPKAPLTATGDVGGPAPPPGIISDTSEGRTSATLAALDSTEESTKDHTAPLSGHAASGSEAATGTAPEDKISETVTKVDPKTLYPRLLSTRRSAPPETSSLLSEESIVTHGQEQAAAVLAATSGARSMRRVVSADRVRPAQKQKRSPEGGNRSTLAIKSSLEAAAAAAVAAVEREQAAAIVQAAAEPPKKRHLSPGDSAGSGSAGGVSGASGCPSQSLSSSDRGHHAGMSPFLDSHPAEGSLIKRASSSSGASVAKLALALADARLSLTSENSMGGNLAGSLHSGQLPGTATAAGSEPDVQVASFLNSSIPCPMDAGAFSTGRRRRCNAGDVPDTNPEDASIAAAAAASATAAAQTAEAVAQVQPMLLGQQVSAQHVQMLDPSHSRPQAGVGVGTGAQSPSSSSAVTVAGMQNAPAAREEASSRVVPDSRDPLLHACFNAQLLAYSTDPALLDRSTEILMIMLESGGQISPDVISFNIILRTVCATEHLQVAPALLEMMGIARVTPLVSTYAIYMAGAASAGDPWLVEHGWQAMLSAHIVPDITCIMLYLSALFQLGQCMDAATLFLRIASPPVFLAPDADLIAMILSIWMHHQLATAGGAASNMERNVQRTAATQQDTFAMTSSLCHAIGAHAEVAIEATQILIEELVRAGRLNAMQAALTAQQQLVASSGAPHSRVPMAQSIGQLLTTMLHGGVAKCAGTCVGGLVRRACESILRLGGAPLPDGASSTSTAVAA